jgi:hypothetical protein
VKGEGGKPEAGTKKAPGNPGALEGRRAWPRSDRAAALRALGAGIATAVAAAAATSAAPAAAAEAVATLAALAAAFAMVGGTVPALGAGLVIARAAVFAAGTAATASAAVAASAVTVFTVVALAVAGLAVASAGRRGGCGAGAAEEALEPAEETAGGLGLGLGSGRQRTARLEAGLAPRFTRLEARLALGPAVALVRPTVAAGLA